MDSVAVAAVATETSLAAEAATEAGGAEAAVVEGLRSVVAAVVESLGAVVAAVVEALGTVVAAVVEALGTVVAAVVESLGDGGLLGETLTSSEGNNLRGGSDGDGSS